MDLRDMIEDLREEQYGTLRTRCHNRCRAMKLEYKYSHEMDLNNIRYIKTGALTMKFDTFAPASAEPLGVLCSGNVILKIFCRAQLATVAKLQKAHRIDPAPATR